MILVGIWGGNWISGNGISGNEISGNGISGNGVKNLGRALSGFRFARFVSLERRGVFGDEGLNGWEGLGCRK